MDEVRLYIQVLEYPVSIRMAVTDKAFPVHDPLCSFHLRELERVNVAVVDGIDVFALPCHAPLAAHWDLAIFSGPHYILSNGTREENVDTNGEFIWKVFMALEAHHAISTSIVIFAQQHLVDLQHCLACCDVEFRIERVAEVVGWTPRRSNPTSLMHNVCEYDEILALFTKGGNVVVDQEGNVDILATCTNACSSLLCLGSGCAHLESIIAAHLGAQSGRCNG